MITDDLFLFGESADNITVSLSNELVQLLSDQLYSSPLKAIEELVVNSYDADAKKCAIYKPAISSGVKKTDLVIVYDDGQGMDKSGLSNLWQIGRSNKRSEEIIKRSTRKLIGKFGIGKLATYSIANEITYISKSNGEVHSVSLNYNSFASSGTGAGEPISLPVVKIADYDKFYSSDVIKIICTNSCIDIDSGLINCESWTIVILQNLKDKINELQTGRLMWILSTAMPLQDNFTLHLNCTEIVSSKASYKKIAEYDISEIPSDRLERLNSTAIKKWIIDNKKLKNDNFPSGVSGNVTITERSMQEGKSADLSRSNGFFVRVRGRLVNLTDGDFGLTLSSTETYARFRADIYADDLDIVITAPREGIETSTIKDEFQKVLQFIYNDARARYEKFLDEKTTSIARRKEGEREHILPQLVEYPIADILSFAKSETEGSEADESWFYLKIGSDIDLSKIAIDLYSNKREGYSYKYESSGRINRMVSYDPISSTFWINEDHDLVRAHTDNPRSKLLLEDFVTAETLLEVYLRERNIEPHLVGEILEKRDKLLRSLAKDHPYSPKSIGSALKDSSANDHDLEVNLVVSARSLGFTAKHIAGSNEPDGIARFTDSRNKEHLITLEAKSSIATPSLSAFDFAGLQEHMTRHGAEGCLLVAPSYPGESRGEDSSVSLRAKETRISCWTVDQLARVVQDAEARHITAKIVYDLVTSSFSPEEVTTAIENLFESPSWKIEELYKQILNALRVLESKLKDNDRNVDQIATVISLQGGVDFENIGQKNIEKAIQELAGASKGGLIITENRVTLNVTIDELERRVNSMTNSIGLSLEKSSFRKK